jgi:glycosyltransferase involved in cell wall biosynthesis
MAAFLNARAPVWRARIVNARFPRMHDAATGNGWRVRQVGEKATGRKVVMLVVSDLRVDPRVEREARALASAGYLVTVICPEPSDGAGAKYNIDWGGGVRIKYIHWTGSTFMNEKPGYDADLLYLEAMRTRPFAFHAHDLSTAYAALAAARVRGSHLIVDFHEWFSENVHWDNTKSEWVPYPPDWKRELQKLEARCLSEASATITVCDSIADAMTGELGGRRPRVIRNIPSLKAISSKSYLPLKQQLGISESYFVVLWQGGTGPTRLIEPIIESLRFAPRCVFVVRGPSLDLFGEGYRALARQAGVEDRLILTGPVPSGDVVAAARGADAGIWTLPALCRNFTFALPNKIFEYIASGLPVLAAHYPEAKRLLADHDVGLTFDPYDPCSIAAAINQLIEDPALATRFRTNTSAALQRLDAGAEWQKLVTLYDSLPRIGLSGRSFRKASDRAEGESLQVDPGAQRLLRVFRRSDVDSSRNG